MSTTMNDFQAGKVSTDPDHQVEYWDRVADQKTFTLPVHVSLLTNYLTLQSRILDYGCGYGRVGNLLAQAGFTQVTGVDFSPEMIRRGRDMHPGLNLEVIPEGGLSYPADAFDAVLLVAVLTCIPTNAGQRELINTTRNLLRPGGLLYLVDYGLQEDERNLRRYRQFADELGAYGMFRLPEGVIVRHHSLDWIDTLTDEFETLDKSSVTVSTMNGHCANAFQHLYRK
ncbi:MAG: class I SAM-dependent methyltransferase [Anaerolineales bacterium]|nr:class I SAM-dependent methyltransferase [Anaerolineales bacterium]